MECEKTLDRANPRHYVDMFLIEQQEQEKKKNPDYAPDNSG